MGTIKQFEDLRVWRSARKLVNLIYEQTGSAQFAKDFALRDQIRKAAISIMSNIAEGFDAGYDNEFIRFLGYSFRSTAEVQSQLYTALDQSYIDQAGFDAAYVLTSDVRRQTRALLTYLSNNKRGGRIREVAPDYVVTHQEADMPNEFFVD